MPLNRRELTKRESAIRGAKAEPEGVVGLLHSVRRDPTLRNFVTVDSAVLAPVPHLADRGLELRSLLATVRRRSDDLLVYHPPWGMIGWLWSSKEVSLTVDLREERMSAGNHRLEWLLQENRGWSAPSARARIEEETRLCQLLDEALGRPWPPDSSLGQQLTEVYLAVLPTAAVDLYHHLLPDTTSWLGAP